MNKTELELEKCPVEVEECHWLEQLAQLRLENEQLKLLVTTDPLTGLYNYRYFREILDTEMHRTNRSGRPTCLVMIDLDYFKAVNDKWGHEGGNVALQTAADIFREQVRQSDIVCRYGGEEFTLILPETTLPIAVNVAQRIRERVQDTPVRFEGSEFNMTASFGVSIYRQTNDYTEEAFVDSADSFLYLAKQLGRNQVCHPDYDLLRPDTEVSGAEKAALFGTSGEDQNGG